MRCGPEGVRGFLQHLLGTFEERWGQLATWHKLDPEQERALVQLIEQAYKGKVDFLRDARDRRLSAMLKALEQARTT